METEAEIAVELTGTSRVWIAKVRVLLYTEDEHGEGKDLYNKVFKGASMKHPADKTKNRIGAELALGRALESAGKRLQKVAWAEVPPHVPSVNHPSMRGSADDYVLVAPDTKKFGKKKDKRVKK